MSNKRIKTQWAAIRITESKNVIVYTMHKDRPVILTYEDTDNFKQTLAKKELIVSRWAVSLPDNFCIQKNLDLPAQSLEEASQMLEFELSSLVPISVDEIIYGCTALKQNENVFDINAYILQKNTLDQLLEPYLAVGIYPEKAIPDSISLNRVFKDSDSASSIFLFSEKDKYHVLTTLKNHLRDYSCLTYEGGTQDLKSLADKITGKNTELQVYSDNIDILIAAYSTDQVNIIQQALKETDIQNPIKTSSLPACLSETAESLLYESVLAIGTFETIDDNQYKFLNLLPAEHIQLSISKAKRMNLLLHAGLFIILLLLIWANFYIWNWRTKRACLKVQSLIAPIEHIASDVEQKKLLTRVLQGQTSHRDHIMDVFTDLYNYGPAWVTISEVVYKQKDGRHFITLKGQTDDLSKPFEYSEIMKKSKLLNQMQTDKSQLISTPGGSIGEFKAECSLEGK